MYYIMERAQERHRLSDRLIRAISHWQLSDSDDDIQGLIEAGADVNRIHGTLLPLHCACMVGDVDILRLLLRKGAKVNAVDGYERTAIHYAAERDGTCLGILLQNGAYVNQGDGNQDTALHWASYKNNVACVRLLLQHGANVNAVDYNNDTPISWAARKGNLEVIKILLDYNADIEIRNSNGNTPLQRSAFIQASGLNTDQDNACLELLIKASGRFDLLTDQGQPVPAIARDNRINEMLRPMCDEPRVLLDLCRRQIRHSLGQVYLPNVMRTLPLPLRLQDFLLLRDGKEVFLECFQEKIGVRGRQSRGERRRFIGGSGETEARQRESDLANNNANTRPEEVKSVEATVTHAEESESESDTVNNDISLENREGERDTIGGGGEVEDGFRITEAWRHISITNEDDDSHSVRGDGDNRDSNRILNPSSIVHMPTFFAAAGTLTTTTASSFYRNRRTRISLSAAISTDLTSDPHNTDNHPDSSTAVETDEKVGTCISK